MKSLLQEASTIERAIDKAWNEAGKPTEFTIKIHDQGERNFLGMSRRPAIISIIYKPERTTYQVGRKDDRSRNDRNDRSNERSRNSSRGGSSSPRRYEGGNDRGDHRSSSSPSRDSWQPEWRDFVVGTIKQLTKLMNVTVPFTGKVTEDKVLTITFKESILGSDEEQRMLFASLSYLAIQFLKREHKNRFAGFRIVVTGPKPKGDKKSESSDKADTGSTEEKRAPRTSSRTSRSSSGRSSSSRSSSGRSSSPRRVSSTQVTVAPTTASEEIVDEQLRFAQEQLNAEPVADVQEHHAPTQAVVAEPAPTAEPAPVVQAEKKAAPKRVSKPLKKDQKHQPFFVLPDDEDAA